MKKFLLNRSYKKLSRFILAILFLGFSMQLYATHFRYGYWSWSRDPTYVGAGFKINFKLTESWRRGFPWNQYAAGNALPPNVGNIIDFGGNFPISFGDGSPTVNVLLTVTSISAADDWVLGEFNVSHVYTTAGTYVAFFEGSARFSTASGLQNNGDGSFRCETGVTVGNANDAPVSGLPPIVNMITGLPAASYQIPASDPNGDGITFSLAPSTSFTQVGFTPINTQPPGLSVSPSGLITFNTVGKAVGQYWNAVFRLTDARGAYVHLDVLIKITAASAAPVYDYTVGNTPSNGHIFNIIPGQNLSFLVKAKDPDVADNVTLFGNGIPIGATLTPPLPFSGAVNAFATTSFSWTPTVGQTGTFLISFIAQDPQGVQTPTSVTVVVCLPPTITCPANITVNNTTGLCGANVNYTATSTGTSPTITYSPPSGNFFPIGTTTVTATSTNGCGTSSCQFTVTVVDAQPPSITCAGPVTINNSPGLCTGTTTLTAPTVSDNCPAVNKALNFNAGADGVTSNATANIPIGNSARTFSAWVNPSALNSMWGVVHQGNFDCTGLMFGLGLQSGNRVTFWGGCSDFVSGLTVSQNVWTYIAVTYDGANNYVLYMNNTAVPFTGGALNTQPSKLFVGHETINNGANFRNEFQGSIDEVRIYNRKLTAAEIATDRSGTNPAGANLVLYYPFNEGSGTVIHDVAGNNPATLVNPTGSNWVAGAPTPASYTVSNNAPAIYPKGNTTVTWTAIDGAGNSSSCTQTVTVVDNQPPSITCPAGATVQCAGDVPAPNTSLVTANDNCAGVVSITWQGDVTTAGGCPGHYTIARTYKATDVAGNSATCTQTFIVNDNIAPVISALPAPSTIDCPATPSFDTPTTSDNCDTNPSLTFNDVITPGGCAGNYSIKRTWTARDNCGNTSTASQTINVQDITPPSISALKASPPIDCPDSPSFATPTASDDCDPNPSLTFNDVITPGDCAGNYSVTRTWTARDECGNTSTVSQTINVHDVTPPRFSAMPAPITINCPATPSFATPTATDACDPNPSLTFSDATTPGSCAGNYSVTRTWTARDECGNTSTASQTINVQDVTAPTISVLPAPSTIDCPATPSFATPTVDDNCDANPSLMFSDVRTPGNCAGNYSVTRTWTARDECGNTSTASQTINVQDVTAPTISVLPAPSTIDCPATPSFATPTAADNCDGSPSLIFSDATTAGSCAGNYSVTRTWTATDACGNSSTASQTINVHDVTAPTISTLPAASTINCPATPSFATPTAADNCDGSPSLTFSDATTAGSCAGNYSITRTWTARDACGNTSTASQTINVHDVTAPTISALPAPSTIDCPATPSFATPTAADNCDGSPSLTFSDATTAGSCAGNYSVTRTWTATDACGNSSTASQTINVHDVTAPTISTLPAASTINCPATPSFATPTAADNCDGSPSLTFSDATTAGSCAGNYSVTRTWTATDACGNSSTASQTINVHDVTAPTISTLPAASTINCPATPSFATPTAADNCDGSPSLTFSDATTAGSCAGNYSITRTWTARDACGNTSTASQTINVHDVTAPTISALPAPSTIDCPATPSFATPTASDDCDGHPSLTSNDVRTQGNCAGNYSITRTWTARDACGNISTASQTINVHDVTPPSISALPAPSTIDCPAAPSFATPTAADNCDGSPSLTFSDATTAGSCAGNYSVTRTWTAVDACGNRSTASQRINVHDVTPPTISALPAESTINCPATPSFATPTATDACDPNPSLTFNDVRTAGSCAGNYSITRTWTARDACGNISTASQKINVHDVTPPVITCPASIIVNNTPGQCGANVSFVATATDACGMGGITYSKAPGSFFAVGTTVVTATATDACGNSSQCNFNVTVNDNEKPVITVQNLFRCFADDNNGCSINLGATATDNCMVISLTSNAPACFAVGTTTVTWTATDNHGNVSTKTQTVTRNPEINIDICAGPTRTIYTGTYQGVGPFGPQSVNLTSTVSGGTPGYTYKWTPAAGLNNALIANPVASPTVTTIYTLMVTDSKGCTRSLSITINVLPLSAASCGGSGNNVKFNVCHIPPGSPSNPQNICISVNALPAHLTSGSNGHNNCYLGLCDQRCFSTSGSQSVTQPITSRSSGTEDAVAIEKEQIAEAFDVNVYPNPSTSDFSILVSGKSNEPVVVRIIDMNGVVRSTSTVVTKSAIKVGTNLRGGTYMAEVIQGANRRMVKLVKLN